MKQIASPKELFSRAWTALEATWPIVLPLVAVIQMAAYVLNQLVLQLPDPLNSILSLVVTAVIMVPTVGVLSGVISYLRGQPLSYDCIRSMLPHALKIIGLYLWTMLCLFAWMLPGMGGMVIGTIMLAFGQQAPALGILGGLLMIAGVVMMLVLAIRAAFAYSLSNCILVDNPDVGTGNALKQSKTMMQGYRWHYFKVGLPLFVGILVLTLITGALTAVLPLWLASLISSAMSVLTATVSQYFLPVMYEELRRIGR